MIFSLWHTAVMEKLISKFISLQRLSAETKLPKNYLLELVQKNKIPALNIGSRLRFNPEAVEKALADLAAKGVGND